MTYVLIPPHSTEVTLTSYRWEVETSVPVAITGNTAPGDADFVITSYATQSLIEDQFREILARRDEVYLPLEASDDFGFYFREVFDDLRRLLAEEYGLRDSRSIFASNAILASVLINGQVQLKISDHDGVQMLRDMLAEFVELSTGIQRIAQRSILEEILEQFPVPIFGSPPSDINTITKLMQKSPFLAAVGYGVWSESPALVVLSAGTGLVVWFARPSANVLRRSIAERLADRLGTKYRREDEE